MREEGGEGGLADAAFAREDEDLVADGGKTGGDEWDVGVGPLGCGGADGLVGATRAGVAFACCFGLWTGAVLWRDGLVQTSIRE